jgi:hypothetical protein
MHYPMFRLLGQLWARNCAMTLRKLAAQSSFVHLKNVFVRLQFEIFVCALEKLIGAEFPA